MVSTKNQNPADASADNLLWPDWNAAHGVGNPVPDNRNVSEDLGTIYTRQRAGEAARLEADEPEQVNAPEARTQAVPKENS